MTPQEHAELIRLMEAQPGMDHEFVVTRTLEAQDRDGLGTGISAEALEELTQQMITWVGTRMLRFERAHGIMPQNVKVTMSVELGA